jgi:hypothetical protein
MEENWFKNCNSRNFPERKRTKSATGKGKLSVRETW